MVKQFRGRNFFIFTIMSILCLQAAMATTTARVGRTAVGISDSFEITFETDQSVDEEPDFSALTRDFDILSRAKSTSINIINGSMQRATRWKLDVIPKREGKLVIPPVAIGNESSNAVNMTVAAQTPAAGSPGTGEIDLEIDIDNFEPYVQGQIIFTLRLVHAVSISEGNLSEPSVSNGDALIQKLGDDVSYETQRGADRVGIIERRYAIFPQTSGKIVIGPVRFEGRVAADRRFGFDPFARGRIVRKQTDPVELDVKPVPPAFSGGAWLPAKALLLTESSPDNGGEYRVGEPFTRVITLQATGLSSSQLPKIDVPAVASVKAYPDQPALENRTSDEGMVGIRQEKIALIPSQAGAITLAAIEVPWWNTVTGQTELATLPAKTIQVLPAAGNNSAPLAQPAAPVQQQAPGAEPPKASPLPDGDNALWQWLSLALGTGWLLTLIAWFLSRRRGKASVVPAAKPAAEKELLAKLQQACETNDAEASKSALLQWAELRWPGTRIRSLGELAAQFDGDLQTQLHQLSQKLYSPTPQSWDGRKLWNSFADRQQLQPAKDAQPQLEPLYY